MGSDSLASRATAEAVCALHTLLMVFLAIAWALPWTASLWIALLVYPVVLLNWWAFDNRCVLTILEERLRGGATAIAGRSAAPRTGDGGAENAEPEENFVSRALSGLVGRPVPVECADRISYTVVCGGLAVAALRLWLRNGG